jgi:hypothetical protein
MDTLAQHRRTAAQPRCDKLAGRDQEIPEERGVDDYLIVGCVSHDKVSERIFRNIAGMSIDPSAPAPLSRLTARPARPKDDAVRASYPAPALY